MVGHPLLTARAFKALAITPGGCFMHGTQCKLCRGAAIMDMISREIEADRQKHTCMLQ